jgi:hypothetical protein
MNNIESIQLNLKIKYLNNILNAAIKQNIDYTLITSELEKLKNQELENITISATEKNELKKQNLNNDTITDKNISEVYSIDYLYLKPWTKLTQTHKIIKIKEFINGLDINNNDEKDKLKDKMIELLKDKKTKNKITYDETKGKLISMSALTYDKDHYCIKKD